MQITRRGGERKGETTRAISGEQDDVELKERQRERELEETRQKGAERHRSTEKRRVKS